MDEESVNGESNGKSRDIIWLLTARCNLTCRHCYAARVQNKKEIGPDQALQIVRQAASAGITHLYLEENANI